MKSREALPGVPVAVKGTAKFGVVRTAADSEGQARVLWDNGVSGYIHVRKIETRHCCPQFNGASFPVDGVLTCRYCHKPVRTHDL